MENDVETAVVFVQGAIPSSNINFPIGVYHAGNI